MNIILSLIIACTIALGAPVQPTEQPSQPASQAVCMEDMPCWDSATEGVTGSVTDAQDAWLTFDASGITTSNPLQAVEYIETLDTRPTNLGTGYFVLQSNSQPNAYHVMHWYFYTYA